MSHGDPAEGDPTPRPNGAEGVGDPSLDPHIQAHIGRELRALFDEIVHEPVPDRFLRLLKSLEEKKLDQQ